jgi:predicted ester cyclase
MVLDLATWPGAQTASQGVTATGRQVTMAGIDLSRVVDGKIAERWYVSSHVGR